MLSVPQNSAHIRSAFDFLFIISTFLFHLLQEHQCWFYFPIWNILIFLLNNKHKTTMPHC